jgi:hypothetical protein
MNAPEAITPTTTSTLTFADLPPIGAQLDAGIFIGLTTDKTGQHFAVALLPDKPKDDTELTWKKALAWADGAGGTLPTRPVSALLFANAKDQFEETWYWTSEEHGGSYAWFQYFTSGHQNITRKDDTCRARAVRLIQLTA